MSSLPVTVQFSSVSALKLNTAEPRVLYGVALARLSQIVELRTVMVPPLESPPPHTSTY